MNKLKILYTTVGGVASPKIIDALKSYKKVALNFFNVKKILEKFITYN